jgi:hypothetical protein
MKKRLALIPAVAAIAATVAVPTVTSAHGARPAAGSTQTFRIFDKPVALTLTRSNGEVIRQPPYPEAKPGDLLDVYSLEYVGNHLHHASQWTMSAHLHCVFVSGGEPTCQSHIAIGGSMLIFQGNKLVAGTGRYVNATGRVLSTKQVGPNNTSDIVARITTH